MYQELIQGKDHVHMNSTKWTTLTNFEASSIDRSGGYAPIALKLRIKSKPQKKVKKISITFDSYNDSNEVTVKHKNTAKNCQ